MADIIIIGLEIVIGLLSAYLLYYAQQKGKNQADKQDLKKITEIVEEVKKKNSEEIEFVKAKLLLLINRESQLFNEEKESIVIFFSQLNTWIWDSLNIYIHDYNYSNYQDIPQRLILIRDAYNKTNVAYSKVKLIINDEELVTAGNQAILETLKLHHFKEGLLKRLFSNLSLGKVMVDQIINKEIDLRKISPEMADFYQNQARETEREKKEITDEYFAKINEVFNPAMSKVNIYKDLAKKYLRK